MDTTNSLTAEQIKILNFEEAYQRLNETAAQLERGNLSLENSLSLYEEGVLLSQHCEELLSKAELRITQITPTSTADDEVEEDDEDYEDEAEDNEAQEQLLLSEIDF